jgi:hypothetical protein
MAVTGAFVGLTASELATLRTQVLAAMQAVLNVGQSYSIGGRSFTKADLPELRDMIAEINYAQGLLNGTGVNVTVPRFRFP